MEYKKDNRGSSTVTILMVILIMLLTVIICFMGFFLISSLNKKDSSQNNQSQASSGSTSTVATQTTTEATTQASTSTSAQTNTQPATTATKPANTATNNYYIIEGSDSRYVTVDDLSGLSSWELKCARNEIYARHGRLFDNDNLQNYFNSQAWYSGTVSPSNFSESVLNKYEKSNIDFIKKYEDGDSSGTSTNSYNDYYILPYSNYSYISYSDLDGLSQKELKYARNEIYARHGRRFDNKDLQDYFDSQAWYSGTVSPSNFSESVLNKYEKANISTIKDYESSHY